jgi:chromosome segregation ATPase
MSGDRSPGVVSYARELERRDADVAARIDSVVGLLERVDAIRASARRVLDALDALPAAIAVAEQSEREALAREVDARAELAEAERRLAEVNGSRRASDEAKTEAGRAARRAAVAATDAAETVARMRERVQALAADAVALGAEADGIAVEAQHVAREVAAVPRLSDSGRAAPDGTSLAEIDEWGARAHAALFVVRGGLESEREKVVVEAHALAEAALGEQTAGVSVALVRRRLEESLAEG